VAVAVQFHFFRGDHDNVYRFVTPVKIHVDSFCKATFVKSTFLDDKEIDITMGIHFATRCRAEQYNFLRVRDFYNPPHDLPECSRTRPAGSPSLSLLIHDIRANASRVEKLLHAVSHRKLLRIETQYRLHLSIEIAVFLTASFSTLQSVADR